MKSKELINSLSRSMNKFGFKIKKVSRDECFNHPCVVTVGIQDTKEKLYVLNIATKDNDDIQVRMLDDGKIQRFNDKNKFEVATKNGITQKGLDVLDKDLPDIYKRLISKLL